jgi:hypothetical protein
MIACTPMRASVINVMARYYGQVLSSSLQAHHAVMAGATW